MTDFYAAQHEAHRRMVLEEERRKVNRLSHRRPVRHDSDCGIPDCSICNDNLFVCADCGSAEAQLEEVHCVDRLKDRWQQAIAVAVNPIVDDWETDVEPGIARYRLGKMIAEMNDRRIEAERKAAEGGMQIAANIHSANDRAEEAERRLAELKDFLDKRIEALANVSRPTTNLDYQAWNLYADRIEALVKAYAAKLYDAERRLSDWREGDREGVAAHMHAFREQAQRAEARVAELEGQLRNARRGEVQERHLRRLGDERIIQAKIALTGLHVKAPPEVPEVWSRTRDERSGSHVTVRQGVCINCGHRHPPDGRCV